MGVGLGIWSGNGRRFERVASGRSWAWVYVYCVMDESTCITMPYDEKCIHYVKLHLSLCVLHESTCIDIPCDGKSKQ